MNRLMAIPLIAVTSALFYALKTLSETSTDGFAEFISKWLGMSACLLLGSAFGYMSMEVLRGER